MQDIIFELERKIDENKRQLNCIRSDIEYMEQQVNMLKHQMTGEAPVINEPTQPPIDQYAQPPVGQFAQPPVGQFVQPPAPQYAQPPAEWLEQPVYYQQPKPSKKVAAPKTKSKDMETAVGKTIMGIAASLLIFISLVLFAKLIIPYLTDTIKLVLMYMVSIGIATFGLIKLNKNRDSVLFLSISGCGIGSIYISLFMSNVYFNVINEVVLYVLLFFWAIGVCVLSKLRSEVFNIIGQAGILISVFYGTQFCMLHHDLAKQLIIVIYFIVGSLIFYFTHNNSEKNYVISSSFNLVNIIILYCGLEVLEGAKGQQSGIFNAAMLLLLVYVGFKLILPLFWPGIGTDNKIAIIKKYENSTGIVNSIFYILGFVLMENLIATEDALFGIMLIITAFYVVALELVREKKDLPVGVLLQYILLTSAMVIATFIIDGLNKLLGVALIVIPYLIYGYIKDSKFFRITAIILMFLFIPNFTLYLGMWIALGIIMLGGAMYLVFKYKEQYSIELKNTLLGMMLFFVALMGERLDDFFQMNYQTMACIRFVILSVMVGVAAKSRYIENPVTNAVEKGTKTFVDIIIAVFMMIGLDCILYVEEVGLNVIYIIFTIALFVLNAKDQLNDKTKRLYGPYVGLKFTILMIVILSSYNAEGFLISIFCFIFAIISISAGFFVKHKELRIYGLVLSLISVIKLIMIDMTYNNTLGHAVSFFISGVLCFVISAIYARVEKKMKDD